MKWHLKAICALLICQMLDCTRMSLKTESFMFSSTTTTTGDVGEGERHVTSLWTRTEKMFSAVNRSNMRLYAKRIRENSDVIIETRLSSSWVIWQWYSNNNKDVYALFSILKPGSKDTHLFIYATQSNRLILKSEKIPSSQSASTLSDDPRVFILEYANEFADQGYILRHAKTSRYITTKKGYSRTYRLTLTSEKKDSLLWTITDKSK